MLSMRSMSMAECSAIIVQIRERKSVAECLSPGIVEEEKDTKSVEVHAVFEHEVCSMPCGAMSLCRFRNVHACNIACRRMECFRM